ncbi:MAG TPA: UDP-N-acetylmuramoyl-tripeptide--D-alanyl-D-alanine ligase [Abditibacteriaceae bacterium]
MSAETTARNLASFTLSQAAQATRGRILTGDPSTHCTGVSADTRTVATNNLFVALRGERFDAHEFLPQAQAAGALSAIVENTALAPRDFACIQVDNTLHALGDLARYHRLRFSIPVVGITGSYGKTTTRALMAAALGARLRVLATAGNFNNEIGLPMTLFGLNETHDCAVLEMAMRGLGQIKYLAEVAAPTVGVVTNIGPQHIELLGGMDKIAQAKAELIEALPNDGVAVLPVDDEYSQFLRERAPCEVVTFGSSETADYRVSEIVTSGEGCISFRISNPQGETCTLTLPMPGAHNAINAAAALAVAEILGVQLAEAARALENVEVPGARMRVVRGGGITIIDDCYNAGPTSMRAALQTLHDFPTAGRRVAVLGTMKELGPWSQQEHRKLGKLAGDSVRVLVGVGEETREMLDAAQSDAERHWFADANAAAQDIKQLLRDGDVVLVKGSRSVGLEVVVNALANR